MEMILKHSDYFAIAFPICEVYEDSVITDEQIESIKAFQFGLLMLKTIDPAKNAISTIKRLIATGDDIIIYRLVLVPSLAILVSMKRKH